MSDLSSYGFWIICTPALCMLAGSLAVFCVQVREQTTAVFQMFSAGLLISAVANELVPLMKGAAHHQDNDNHADPWGTGLAVTIGMAIGVIFMYGIGVLFDASEDDDDEETSVLVHANLSETNALVSVATTSDSDTDGLPLEATIGQDSALATLAFQTLDVERLQGTVQELTAIIDQDTEEAKRNDFDESLHTLMGRLDTARRHLERVKKMSRRNQMRIKFHLSELTDQLAVLQQQTTMEGLLKALTVFEATVHHIHSHSEGKRRFRRHVQRWGPLHTVVPHAQETPQEPQGEPPLRIAGAAAVVVDAAVDGLLIGLAYIASSKAGLSMAIATCIEMGFLGLAFSSQVRSSTSSCMVHFGIVALPPVGMVVAGVAGNLLGQQLMQQQLLFVGFIAFSTVALLFLVTQELLADGQQKSQGNVYINACFFLGLWAGMMLDKALSNLEL